MKKIKALILFTGLLTFSSHHAQVKGKVIEISKNNDTLFVAGVILVWNNTGLAVTSNENGNFTIPTSLKTNQLNIEALGYEKLKLTIKDTSEFLLLVLKSGIQLNEIEVLYYGSGTEISYLNPIKTEILNERSLMKAACCNLSESFETNPSIDVNFVDAVSGAKQIQMLGLSGQYAQITKENMPYLRGLASNYGLSFIPGTWIQSIQLSKGAGSVINGYESFTGQINTELQNPKKSDKLNFNTYLNENGRNEYNLNLSQRINQKFSVGLLNHISSNPITQDQNADGFVDIPIGNQQNFMNKYAYESGKGIEMEFGGSFIKDSRSGGQFEKFIKNYNDTLKLYQIGIDNEKWEVYSKTGFIFKNKPATSMGLQLSYLNHNQTTFYGNNNYQGLEKTFYANYIYQGFIRSTSNSYKVGFSFMNDEVKESFNLFNFNRNEKVLGTFFEFAKSIKEKINIITGIRIDYHNYYGIFYTPRLHLRYAIKPNTIVRLSGGKALKTASIFTDNSYLMASSRKWTIESSDTTMPYGLKPEVGWNYGLNFTQKFKINFRDAYLTLDFYRTDFINQAVVDIDNNAQKVNIYNLNGPSFSNTIQFEFNMEPRKRLFIKTAYRYVDTQVSYKENLLQKAMVSKHRAFINLSYETKNNHFQFDYTTQYNGAKRLPKTGANPIDFQRPINSPEYFNILAQITYLTKIKKSDLNIYLGVENLLNYKQTDPIISNNLPYDKYFDASMVWGPIYGRMLYIGLRLKIK